MKNAFISILFFVFTCRGISQNLVVDGTISNAANWNGQEAPFNAGTFESAYLAGGCNTNYVMEVDNASSPRQTISGFTSGTQYVLTFRCAYRTSCAPSNNPTNLLIRFTDAPGVLNNNLVIPSTQNVLTVFSYTFTNNAATTHTLQLTSPGNVNTCGTVVDDISITPLSSPGGVGNVNLSLWLKAETINSANNTNVNCWISQGLFSLPFTPPCANSPNYFTGLASLANNLVANYNPYITFNGTNEYLQYITAKVNLLDNSLAGEGGTAFYVYQGGSNGLMPFSHQGTNNSRILGQTDRLIFANGAGVGANNNAAITKSTRVNIISGNGKSSGLTLSDINGLNQSSINGSADVDFITVGVRRNVAGAYSQHFNSNLSEIMVFNTMLSSTEIQQVRSYLAIKYGVTLTDNTTTAGLDERSYLASNGTTVLWNFAANNLYHNNLTVIGRDDASGLTQGKSVNTDVDAGSNTGNAMLIVDNVAAITNDNSFFATGHNGISIPTGANFTDVPPGIQSRLQRVWKFQKTSTGIANSITVRFDMSGIAPLTGSDLRLLVSNSAVFAGASVIAGAYAAPYFTASLPTTGGAFYTVASINSTSTPLPITLLHFTAQLQDKNVHVKWTTATEANSDFFTVKRSLDGINFNDIGTKQASGNSNQTINYLLIDKEPLDGVSYYKLKLNNKDASSQEYNIVSVNIEKSRNTVFSIFPNPGNGQFTFDFSGIENNHEVEVVIVSESGKIIFKNTYYSQSLENNQVQINLKEQAAKGIYYCTIQSEGISQTIKVIIN
ncbi:MAG: T9SS type A sorting domain-containing protein [Bacteroidota bacterium]|nr:T9SS type A sorting domain-containing protein [Bacteroidota bacterium]MDP3145080.1 T9SS type A sorting domain-containing protein [Bacteroidota bacterium]